MTAEELGIINARLDEVDEDLGEVKAQLRALPQLQADIQAIRDWVIEEREAGKKLRERCFDVLQTLSHRVLDRVLSPTPSFLALLAGLALFLLLLAGVVSSDEVTGPIISWALGAEPTSEVTP